LAFFDPPNPRYKGKPFLRLLELYVFWAIGELPAKEEAFLENITPNLQTTFKRGGNWQSIIAAEMDFPSDLPEMLGKLWERDCEIARQNRVILTTQQFAEMIVDQNFGDIEPRTSVE
jgi:hypothetical protein